VRVQPELRRRRSRHEVRRLILDAARQTFSEVDYDAAATKAIAERAGVAETSLYRHFGSKRALFETAVFEQFDPWIAGYLERWGASGRSTSSLEAQSRDFISATYDLLTADRALMRLAISSSRDPDPGTDAERAPSPLHQNFARLEYQLANIAVDNEIRGIDPTLVIRPTFGLLYALAALPEWMFGPADPPGRDVLIDEITAIIVYGLTARPPGVTSERS
jgi:AcrR family transcriptional regulator